MVPGTTRALPTPLGNRYLSTGCHLVQAGSWRCLALLDVWRYLIVRLLYVLAHTKSIGQAGWSFRGQPLRAIQTGCVYASGGHEQETPLGENEPGQWWPLIFAVSADGQIYPDSDSEIGDDDEECFGDFKHGIGFFYPDTLATASSSSSHATASCLASSLDGQLPG